VVPVLESDPIGSSASASLSGRFPLALAIERRIPNGGSTVDPVHRILTTALIFEDDAVSTISEIGEVLPGNTLA
jgi:hypothetical protein